MHEKFIRWTLRLHPRAWRVRYGNEIHDLAEELVEGDASKSRLVLGLLASALREWVRVGFRHPRRLGLGAAVVIVVLGGGAVLLQRNSGPTPHSVAQPSVGGPISIKNGKVHAPDFIGVIGNGKLAGYEPRSYLFPTKGPAQNEVAPVYARDLHTLVGHEYPGIGFVPLGRSPASEPCSYEADGDIYPNGQMTWTPIACPSTIETVPNVVGAVTPTAMGTLSDDSLQANIKYVHSASVDGGHIVSITPAPGTRIHARSIVTVVSSLGSG
jgi:hypothetical protein